MYGMLVACTTNTVALAPRSAGLSESVVVLTIPSSWQQSWIRATERSSGTITCKALRQVYTYMPGFALTASLSDAGSDTTACVIHTNEQGVVPKSPHHECHH